MAYEDGRLNLRTVVVRHISKNTAIAQTIGIDLDNRRVDRDWTLRDKWEKDSGNAHQDTRTTTCASTRPCADRSAAVAHTRASSEHARSGNKHHATHSKNCPGPGHGYTCAHAHDGDRAFRV